jgi:hypothetical protein
MHGISALLFGMEDHNGKKATGIIRKNGIQTTKRQA